MIKEAHKGIGRQCDIEGAKVFHIRQLMGMPLQLMLCNWRQFACWHIE